MALQIGAVAPDFATTTLDGLPLKLDSLRGRRIFLSFFRAASCPLCNLRVWYLAQRAAAWEEQGLAIVGIFESDGNEIRRYCAPLLSTFPMVADPDKQLFRLYEARESFAGVLWSLVVRLPDYLRAARLHRGSFSMSRQMPQEFLIDETGHITLVHYGQDNGDYLPFKVIADFADTGIIATQATV